jgi:amidase
MSKVAVSDLAFAGAARQAEMLRAKDVSSRELTEMYLERIERIDPGLNAYREVWGEAALREADGADGRLGGGEEAPLLGVPIAIKDTLDVAGDVTTLGTAGFDEPAGEDSILVSRLRDAGAVILGKTNLPELAIHGFTESKTFGISRNPWNPERTTGGSSGGSAAAVAAGLASVAHASDGAGSIRYPAAHNGLFGLKPQRDRVPIDAEHWHGLSANGCVSRTVADTALFLDAVTAGRPWSPAAPPSPDRPFGEAAASPPGRLRIAVTLKSPRALAPPLLGDEVRAAVEETADLLRSLGHDVEWRDPEFGNIGNQIAPRYLHGIAEDVEAVPHPERLEGVTRGYRRLARVAARDWALRRALRLEETDRDRVGQLFRECDVLVTPLTAGPAFEHGRLRRRTALGTVMAESRFYPNAVIWNHLGQPAAAVPAGRSAEDLPLAVQIVGRPNDEGTLLSLAAQLEAERPWADRTPPEAQPG